jgi:hypothetical protein
MRFVLGGVVALLLVSCGAETGRTQAQRQADAYVAAFRTQTGKVFQLRDVVSSKCAAADRTGCIQGVIDMAKAAKDAPRALPAAPSCMSVGDNKARAGFSQVERGSSGSLAALAAQNDAQIKATSAEIAAGADQIEAAATAIDRARC